MALRVSTRNGQPFRRCGLVFGSEPVTVDDAKLAEKLGEPSYSAKKPPTVGHVLTNDSALFCEPVGGKRPAGQND